MASRPTYPVYVISKGRASSRLCLTARFLLRDRVPFLLVVEPQEYDDYVAAFPNATVQALPFANLGLGGIPARNWCWEHSLAAGHERHWILDDNLSCVKRWYKGKRIPCDAGTAFRVVEDFVDRYENVAIAGLNYEMFCVAQKGGAPPFYLNAHVYSCLLILNSLTNRWRGRYNEDADLCLQVLSGGWCTVLINAFMVWKPQTMRMSGGNMETLYQGDGRLKMARSLERVWPGVVSVRRRFQRPQHHVKNSWRKFDTQLRLKHGIDLASMATNEYGLTLRAVTTVKSPALAKLLREHTGER
ncbi:MAG: hypothetical protein ABIW79_02380 [Gemmatimonas sp.]